MKVNRKNLVIIFIILITIIIVTFIFILQKNNIRKIMNNFNKKEETIIDGIECKVYDNTTEKLKSLIIISRVNGIESIEYIDNNGKIINLNCNNKQQVGIDLEIEVNKEYNFKVNSTEGEKIEKIQLDENYINDYIRIIKLVDEEEKSYNEVNIEFDLLRGNTSTKQYRINKGPWVNYTNTIQMDLGDIDIEKLKNGEYDTTIYVRTTDEGGNILQNSKTIEITKRSDFDLFQSMDVSGKTNPSEYGLDVTSWTGTDSEWRWFQVRAIGGGHYRNSGSYSVVIIMNWKNEDITFDSINTNFQFYVESSYYQGASGSITINYIDGTSNYASISHGGSSSIIRNTTLSPDKNKRIKNIQFVCSGNDGLGDGTWSRIREIYFNGLQKVND